MKIIIVRHGDPDYEKDSLTDKGFREAELLSQRLVKIKADAYYCSPLGRAKDTARPTLEKLGKTAQTLDWLREFEGRVILEGKRVQCWDRLPDEWTGVAEYYTYDKWYNTPLMQTDNAQAEYEKVRKGIDELLLLYGYEHSGRQYKVLRSNHDTIMLFCHFAVEAAMLSHIFSCSPMVLWHNFIALPTSVTTLVSEERTDGTATFRCMGFGDLSHLYAADEEPAFAGRFCECFSDPDRH